MMLPWIVTFNIGLNQRGMGERLAWIIHVSISVIVKKNHRLVFGNNSDGCHQFLEFVFQYPLIAGQVDDFRASIYPSSSLPWTPLR